MESLSCFEPLFFFFFLVLHRFLPVCTDLGSLNVYPLYFWLEDWDKNPTFPDKTLCYQPWCFPVLFTSQAENPPPNSLIQLLSSSQTSSSSCSLWSSRVWGSPLQPSHQTADLFFWGGGSQIFLCDRPHSPSSATPLKHTWRPTWPTTGLQLLSSVSVIVWVRHTEVKLNLYNVEIERVHETKFLGVIIDNKVCWKAQMKHVKPKWSKSISILYKTRGLLNKNCLHLQYFSIAMPCMTYCVEIWGNAYEPNFDPIFKLQKRAINMNSDTTILLFIRSHTLKFQDIVHSKTLEITFWVVNK